MDVFNPSRKPRRPHGSADVPPASPAGSLNQNLQPSEQALTSTEPLDQGDPSSQEHPPAKISDSSPGQANQYTIDGDSEASPVSPDLNMPEFKNHDGLKEPAAGANTKNQSRPVSNRQAKFTTPKRSHVWDIYTKNAEEEDKDLFEDWDRIIDVTLVFAALFSAISTGFLLESSKNLQTDQNEATVLAVRDLTSVVQAGFNASVGSASADAPMASSSGDTFKPTITAIWVNCLWFLSLGLSVTVSLLAMLAKRWCYELRSKRFGTSYDRMITRQKSWESIEQWKIKHIIEQLLPMLMHVALLVFFIGLVVYLSEIDEIIMIVTTALVGFTFVVYCALTVLPIWFPTCPVVTPFAPMVLDGYRYLFRLYDSFRKRVKQFLVDHDPLDAHELYELLLGLQDLLPNLISIPNDVIKSFWQSRSVLGLFIQIFMRLPANPSTGQPWVIKGCRHSPGRISPSPPPEDSQYAFRALIWILKNTKDRKTVKAVLDHVVNFPEVILGSSASSEQLHTIVKLVFDHIGHFQHDRVERHHMSLLRAPSAILVYLTARPWLHQRAEHGSRLEELALLCDTHYDEMTSIDELNAELRNIEGGGFIKSIDSITRVEALAVKIVLGCTPEMGLAMCTALGKSILLTGKQLPQNLEAEVRSALWWIFLNCVVDCTDGSWPCGGPGGEPANDATVSAISDSVLTLNHFRDSKMRQDNNLWLAIVGISGTLYALTRMSGSSQAMANNSSDGYFTTLVNILRSTLHTPLPVTSDPDPFIGELPVYNNQSLETRLYQFDALQYGIDALSLACTSHSSSPEFQCHETPNDLADLLRDFRGLQGLKHIRLMNLDPDTAPNHSFDGGSNKDNVRADCSPNIWLASGLLDTFNDLHLSPAQIKFLSTLLPDLLFGRSSDNYSGYIGIAIKDQENYFELCDKVATLAWMPFSYNSTLFEEQFRKAHPACMPVIWQPLQSAGLLRIPLQKTSSPLFRRANRSWLWGSLDASRALGRYIYIKASLLERLYTLSQSGNFSSTVIVEWSIALSKQVAELIEYWEAAEMDSDECVYVTTALLDMTKSLFDASGNNTPPQEPSITTIDPSIAQTNAGSTEDTRIQLRALVDAEIVRIFLRPFSYTFPRITCMNIQEQDAWRYHLATMVDGLVQRFSLSEVDAFNENNVYYDLVAHYDARSRDPENAIHSSAIPEFVKRLRSNPAAALHNLV